MQVDLFLHEMAHGVAALSVNPDCRAFAIQDHADHARCYAQQCCIETIDQMAEVAAGPLFDLLARGRLETTSPPALVSEELHTWAYREVQTSDLQSDAFRTLSLGGMLSTAARFSALRAAWLAACAVDNAYERWGAQIAGIADACEAVAPNALAFERQNVEGWLQHGHALAPTEVHLPFWLDPAGQDEAMEAEVMAFLAAAQRGMANGGV